MTGTGKTLIYLLPILQKLSVDPVGITAIVFSPTRELAIHIFQQFEFYGKNINLRCCLITGGVDSIKQSLEIDKIPHVIVATPGRFYEMVERNETLRKFVKNLKFLVLDEFDQLLNETLLYYIKKSLEYFPLKKQLILTTATFAEEANHIDKLRDEFYINTDALNIINKNQQIQIVDTLSHSYIFVPYLFKDYYFLHILQKHCETIEKNDLNRSIIVFFKNCKDCHFWYKLLKSMKIKCVQIHSFMKQEKRTRNLLAFKEGRVSVMLATDLGARGLDIRAVEWVINYNFPNDYRSYIHRAGRAARGGERGHCLSILTQYDTENFKEMEKHIHTKPSIYKTDEEDEVMKCMNRLDKLKRKVKINFLVKGVDEKFKDIKKSKMKFRKQIKQNN